jgi:hypothetical protein
LSFRLNGDIAIDPVTPAANLKFFLNEIEGPQEIDFPRGQSMNPISAVFAVDGNSNRYPFDRYTSAIRIIVSKDIQTRRSQLPVKKAKQIAAEPDSAVDDFLAAPSQKGEPVQINSSIIASIPGIKFLGVRVERPDLGVEGFNLVMRRSDNVIIVALLIMLLIMSLAVSVLFMSLQALGSEEELQLLPLSLCVSLLFGLPALRNAQPAVPTLGVLGDYVSFIWAEMIVAVCAVMVIWTWLIRRRRSMRTDRGGTSRLT